MDCLFCKIIEGKIPSKKVHEDDEMLVLRKEQVCAAWQSDPEGRAVIDPQASESSRAGGAARAAWTLSPTFPRTRVVSAAAGFRNARG